jgi:hypothetical protein
MILYAITVILFGLLFFASFRSREFDFLGIAFLCSFLLSIIWYNYQSNLEEDAMILEKEKIMQKKNQDERQDSLLIILDAKIDYLFLEKDTSKIKELINGLIHTSNAKSPYKDNSVFSSDSLTYAEYWKQKREEKLLRLQGLNKKSFFNSILDN